ncbi:MAG: hypothetical protein ACI4QR_01465, partial [Eubacteriales bacterium]
VDSKTQFSASEPIEMKLTSTVTFADGYTNALQAANGAVYGTHIISLLDSNNRHVELPINTVVTLKTADGKQYQKVLADASSQVLFALDENLLGSSDMIENEYSITLDFSGVNQKDFNDAFYRTDNNFKLVDSIYLSGDKNLLGSGPFDASKGYTVKLKTAIKLAVVPTDNRYLGINLADPNDKTNSGEIEFSVIAGFDSFVNKTFENVTLSFSVSKKVYNGSGYEYVNMTDAESKSLCQVYKDGTPVTTVTIPVEDKEAKDTFVLKVNLDDPKLTNYRLLVHLSATALGDTEELTTEEYFVFLICNLVTESD